jgi:NAD(P)-dependent dehydrogenase (short-subunit alcohol dehydrogenase family)
MSSGQLTGRVAAVTGAGSGIGLAIARELARDGAKIAILEINPATATSTAQELTAAGAEAHAYQTDVSDRQSVDAGFAGVIRDFGRLDVLVNNAGISRLGPYTDAVSDEDWLATIAVMQTGVFYCMRAAGRIMLEQGSGSVVNIASIRGLSPNPGRIAYCAAKAAVIMMTRVAAGEWGARGVTVNAIAPGSMSTLRWDRDVADGLLDEQLYLETVPLGKIGDPTDVGRLVVYLCSSEAGYMNGSVLTIDGGLTSVPAG